MQFCFICDAAGKMLIACFSRTMRPGTALDGECKVNRSANDCFVDSCDPYPKG